MLRINYSHHVAGTLCAVLDKHTVAESPHVYPGRAVTNSHFTDVETMLRVSSKFLEAEPRSVHTQSAGLTGHQVENISGYRTADDTHPTPLGFGALQQGD